MRTPLIRTFFVAAVIMLLAALPARAQEGTITGTVVGADTGEPLPAVNVGVVGTPLGAATTEDGRFTISGVPVGTYTVQASLVGYSTVEREIEVETDEITTLEIELSQKSVELGAIRVTGRRGGYVTDEVSSANKIGAPLTETPQSVSVITRDQLAARDVGRLSEALRYTPGVQGETFGFEPRTTFLRFRGFDVTTSGLYRNGLQLRNPAFAVGYSPEPYGAERIEVPKGPSSVLYGAGNPGGLVNFISKRPTRQPFGEVLFEPGSYNRLQGKVDLSGPIDEDGTYSYRLTGLLRESDTQVDRLPNDRLFLAPAFSWRPTESTSLTLLGRYQDDHARSSQRLPVSGTLDPNPNGTIPVNRYLGEPSVDRYDRTQWSVGSLFRHSFNEAWTVEQKTRYYSIDVDDVTVFGNAGGLGPEERMLSRSLFESFGHLDGIALDNQAQLDVTTGPIDHTVLAGVDVQRVRVTSVQNFGGAPPIDVFDPTYGKDVPSPDPFADQVITQRQIGAYLQDQLEVRKRWIVTLNGRMDWARTETEENLADSETEQSASEFSGRVGLVYDSKIGLNPYASYSQSFLPQLGTGPEGETFDPSTGEQWEVGAKYQPPGTNSSLTVALFDLTRENFLQTDPETFQQVQTGAANSRGIEVEGVASLGVGLDLTASYTRQDVEITESVVEAEEGERPVQVREQMGTLWADYTLQSGVLSGLGLGGGVRYLGPSYGDVPNTLKAPDVTLVDATVHYEWQGLRFQVNADNVLDNRHVASTFVSGSQGFATYGAARTITATLRYRW
jgi:iron complex outermembrane receptor protein